MNECLLGLIFSLMFEQSPGLEAFLALSACLTDSGTQSEASARKDVKKDFQWISCGGNFNTETDRLAPKSSFN